VNAALNGVSLILLSLGYLFIRRKAVPAHRACMLGSFAASILFLVSYLAYHYQAGSRPFPGQGLIRPVYLFILATHIVLAAAVLPLAIATIRRALKDQVERHRAIARWTLPIWLYVSLTGLVVYVLLYHVYA
jgi:uncharacterized membrane protein YozB (DUF420 family)